MISTTQSSTLPIDLTKLNEFIQNHEYLFQKSMHSVLDKALLTLETYPLVLQTGSLFVSCLNTQINLTSNPSQFIGLLRFVTTLAEEA
ncbi:TPA: hypothetical protein NJY08_004878 [Salmonella enterica subsp. enterica serovar Typhi str. AG3]|nr:hypothetical protein [Salmonella enterica subsp. enterica serovar Typhi str. AG3]